MVVRVGSECLSSVMSKIVWDYLLNVVCRGG